MEPSSSWHGADKVSSVVDRMQGYSGTWMSLCACMQSHPLAHSPRRRQEASPTEAEHVFHKVDAHGHQHTLGDQHRHYASVCCWSSCIEDNDAHVVKWFGQRSHISVPGCNRGKSSLSTGCHHWVHRQIMDDQAWQQFATIDHHKDVEELVLPQRSEC